MNDLLVDSIKTYVNRLSAFTSFFEKRFLQLNFSIKKYNSLIFWMNLKSCSFSRYDRDDFMEIILDLIFF